MVIPNLFAQDYALAFTTVCTLAGVFMVSIIRRASQLRVPVRIQQWGQPFRNIILDYYEVSKDLIKSVKTHPVRSVLGLFCFGAVVYSSRQVPSESSYYAELLDWSNELSLVSETQQNKVSKSHIDKSLHLYANKRLRYVNLGLVAMVMEIPVYPECKNYHNTCVHLQPRWWTFYDRIVDIGIYREWLVIQRKMVDYDINDEYV